LDEKMKHEFKVTRSKDQTVYTLESATGGSTSAGSIASVDSALGGVQRRNSSVDNILAQEKKETPPPRNFVAKNAKMGGAGQHKDKKKAAKQGDVKHKKPLAESSYAEDLAKQVFNANPNIKDENAVLDAAWPIAVKDLGNKRAMSVFNYDQDFPSDLVSVYGWLQKGTSEGVSDLSYDAQSLITKLRRDVEEKRLKPTPQAVLAAARELAGDMEFAPQLLVKQVLGQGMAEGVAGPKSCWPGHRKVGTQPGTGKNAGKRVNDCEKIKKEGMDEDHEIQMASSELQGIAKNAVHLLDLVRRYSEQDGLQAWQQSKITKAADYLNSVLQSISGEQSGMEETRNNYHANTTGFSRGSRDPEGQNLQSNQQVWGLKINGNVWSKDGKDVTFTSKEAALNSRNAILKNRPDLEIGLVTKGGMPEDAYMESLANMLERSVSQAQHNLMVGVAHNPSFAQKVKVKQKVGQEFARADQGHDISKLPIRVPKKK
jgi:hypothetical protein